MSENQIVVYQPNETIRLDVRLENETVWLTQDQMCELFLRERSVITKHIRNVFTEGECEEANNVQILHLKQRGRPLALYSLDVIISVGYRVKSLIGTQFRRWATRVLREKMLGNAVQTAQIAAIDHRLALHDREIVDLKEKVDFFVQTKEPPLQCIFYQGQFWDARSLLIKFIRRAKKELILIDAYLGVATLDMLAKRARGVSIEVVTHSNGELAESDFEAFARQYGKFKKTICGICHDRFIIVDQKEIYWTGASLKDAGRLTFAAAKMGAEIIPGLLESIRKASKG